MSRFSWKASPNDHVGSDVKEDLEVLRNDGLHASVTRDNDGMIEYRISGDDKTVSEWRRLISG
jgi:hypothetical protein